MIIASILIITTIALGTRIAKPSFIRVKAENKKRFRK